MQNHALRNAQNTALNAITLPLVPIVALTDSHKGAATLTLKVGVGVVLFSLAYICASSSIYFEPLGRRCGVDLATVTSPFVRRLLVLPDS